tara:strand:+ start:244 stop:465 length:222 start_codon:yes stop_codon:yes gene_type:complete
LLFIALIEKTTIIAVKIKIKIKTLLKLIFLFLNVFSINKYEAIDKGIVKRQINIFLNKSLFENSEMEIKVNIG